MHRGRLPSLLGLRGFGHVYQLHKEASYAIERIETCERDAKVLREEIKKLAGRQDIKTISDQIYLMDCMVTHMVAK